MIFIFWLFTTAVGAAVGGFFFASPWIGALIGLLIGVCLTGFARGSASGFDAGDVFDMFDGDW